MQEYSPESMKPIVEKEETRSLLDTVKVTLLLHWRKPHSLLIALCRTWWLPACITCEIPASALHVWGYNLIFLCRWVVDKDFKPKGVISMTDIVDVFMRGQPSSAAGSAFAQAQALGQQSAQGSAGQAQAQQAQAQSAPA